MSYYEPEEQVRGYQCPECEEVFIHPAELKWFHFTDGEVRKQCVYCPIHEEETIEFERDIDELDWQT